jgi:acyl-coenzyme A thioesterase PaaI-like protein
MIDLETVRFPFSPSQRALLQRALHNGYNQWAGLRLLEVKQGFARLSFRPRAEMLTPWGTLNGGVINSLVEVPAFVALLTELPPLFLPVTNDIFLQHVRPLPGDVEYELTGRLLRIGKSMAWLESAALIDGKPHTLVRITKTLAEMPEQL